MSKKFAIRQEDFDARFCRFTAPAEIPLFYTIGETSYQGVPAAFKPVVRTSVSEKNENIIRTVVTGTSPEGITVRVEYEEYKKHPVTEWLAFFSNEGKADTPALSDVRYETSFLNRPANQGKPVLVYSNAEDGYKDCYDEFHEKLDHSFAIGSKNGFSCLNAFPYMRLICGGEAGNPSAEPLCVSMAIGWPGTWKTEFEPFPGGVKAKTGFPRLRAALHPGETIRTMRMTYLTAAGDETRSRNMWRRWYFDCILPKDNGSMLKPMLVLVNYNKDEKHDEFECADEYSQLHALREFVRRGLKPDIWWIDAGWYPCDGDWRKVGTWEVDSDRFPRAMTPVGQLCEETGAKFLVWFEPERVYEYSRIDREEPDRIIKIPNNEGNDYFNRLFYLGDPDNLKWMTDRLDALIKENHIKIYRQDANLCQSDVFCLGQYLIKAENGNEDRAGVPENLHVQGYLALWDELVRRNPGLLIDSCAGGGKRNDLETMRRAVVLHISDVGRGNHPLRQRQYSLLHSWIPYFKADSHSRQEENGVYPLRGGAFAEPDSYAYYCSIAASLWATVSYDSPDDLFEFTRRYVGIWRKAADIMIGGDYYRLSECDGDSSMWHAAQFYNDEKDEGFIQFVRNVKCPEDSLTVYPYAEDGAVYTLTDSETGRSFRKTAEELESGLTVTLPPRSGVIYFMKKE